jgi:hypothetical protein
MSSRAYESSSLRSGSSLFAFALLVLVGRKICALADGALRI